VKLASAPKVTQKEVREAENEAALGGMRNPAASVRRLQGHESGSDKIRDALERAVTDDQTYLEVASAILEGRDTGGFGEEAIGEVRNRVRATLGLRPRERGHEVAGLQPEILREGSKAMSDPDAVIADWLEQGAPLGASVQVPHTGVFPRDAKVREYFTEDLTTADDIPGWENYKTAEQEPEVCADLLGTMVKKGWSIAFNEPSEAESFLGVSGLVLNRLGLVTKVKPDGTTKHRLVWDLRRSGVNLVILQGERVVLPRVSDVVDSITELGDPESKLPSVWLLGTDI